MGIVVRVPLVQMAPDDSLNGGAVTMTMRPKAHVFIGMIETCAFGTTAQKRFDYSALAGTAESEILGSRTPM